MTPIVPMSFGSSDKAKWQSLRKMSYILNKVLANASEEDQILFEKLLKQKQKAREDAAVNVGTVEIGTHFARVYIALGILAIILNLLILIVLLIHRRHAFRHVFYLLIFNFATIDCLKGVCLIAYALRMIKSGQIATFKFDQYMTLVFRFCNLATILNLLMITLNEFVFIKFPLRYHQLIDRRLTLILIGLKWLLCIVFTVAFTFAKGSGGSVYVSANYTSDYDSSGGYTDISGRGTANNESTNKHGLWRKEHSSQGLDVHFIFASTLTVFCLVCLAAVLICYFIFFRVIREIQQYDSRLYQDANRRVSELSTNSCDIPAGANPGDRKLTRQLLKRNKYAFVIGLVILVCMLYLLSYSTIQIFQFFHLDIIKKEDRDPYKQRESYIVRWVLQILVGLHSIFQPLCYFRMKEFRQYVERLFCFPCNSSGGQSDVGIPDRDYFTSYAETGGGGPVQGQQKKSYNKRASRNSIVMVKSTNHFRDRIYLIFSRKKPVQQEVDQTDDNVISSTAINNNKSSFRPSSCYNEHNSTGRPPAQQQGQHQETEDVVKELTSLMLNNSGTDL